jgi:hypothetical protein
LLDQSEPTDCRLAEDYTELAGSCGDGGPKRFCHGAMHKIAGRLKYVVASE